MTEKPAPSPPSAPGLASRLWQSPLAHGVMLGLFSLITALMLTSANDLTRAPIAARQAEDLSASLAQVVPADLHDNDPTADLRTINDASEGAVAVYLLAQAGTVTGVAFELSGAGYSGAIRVLMSLDRNGTVLGVRVLSHTETPGLGDKIEAAKDDWINSFSGRSLGDPPPEGWKVKRDGGVFDQFSGATITPRAVLAILRRGLSFFARNAAALTAPLPPQPPPRP